MKQEKPIAYVPHPVTAEQKAEIIAKGFRIVDAIYAPPDAELYAPGKPTKQPKPPKQAPAVEPETGAVQDQVI